MKQEINLMKMTKAVKYSITFVIALFLIIIAISVNRVTEKMEESAVNTTQNLLLKLADHIELAMSDDEKAIQNLANELSDQKEDAIKQLKSFTETYGFLNAYYVGVDGTNYDADGNLFDESKLNFTDTALREGTSGFSDAYNGSYGLWESIYQTPVVRNGQTVGALYVQVELDKYDDGDSLNFYGESGMAYLFDAQTKKIVLMPPTPNSMMAYSQRLDTVFTEMGFSEEQMNNEVYPAIDRREEIVLEGVLQEERVYLSLTSLSNHNGWYLCGIVSADEIQQEASLILTILTTVMLLMVVVMILIILLIVYEFYHHNKVKLEHLREVEMQNVIYDTIADASDGVLCIFNKDSKKCEFTFHNIERILGVKEANFMENDRILHLLLDACDATLYQQMIAGQITDSKTYQMEYQHPLLHEVRNLRIAIKPLEIRGVASYMLMMEDITQDIKLQDSLQAALANATQANQAKSEFLSHMSHEIRTPINAIIGMREIAEHHLADPEKLKDCLNKIAHSSRHLLELINDILDLSKIESGKLSLHQQDFVLSDCLSDVFIIIKTQAEAKKQEFNLKTQGILHDQLIGDEVRIKQILINLLNNAVKYTQKGGEISLEITEVPLLHKDYSNYIFLIRDNGIGMSKDFIEHIGKPFEQETNIFHKSESGSGLGLSIVKNVIAIMGGFMHVDSIQGEGTTIRVELALKHDPMVAYPCREDLINLKVLVVDDDENVLQDVSDCLNEFHVHCDVASSAKDGFAKLQQAKAEGHLYDVAIIDWKMPEENGVALTKRIRNEISKDLPVIFISAYDWSDIEAEAREAGVNDFIEKPLFTKRLYDALTRIEDQPQGSLENELPELQGKRILVVEDNEINREIAVELLQMKGMSTEIAVNGEEAVQRIQEGKPYEFDLILMDLQMPVMDGYEATKIIRAMDRDDTKQIPIIAMTANAFSEDIAHCLEVGMNSHIGKPIEVGTMYERIAKQLRERKKTI